MKPITTYEQYSEDASFQTLLEEVIQFVRNRIYYINNGGCGIFCDYMAQQFESRNIPYRIFEVRSRGGQNTLLHLALESQGFFFDGNRLCTSEEEYLKSYQQKAFRLAKIGDSLSLKELRYYLRTAEWNGTYDRTQNYRLFSGIESKFEIYDNGLLQQISVPSVQTLWTRLRQEFTFRPKIGRAERNERSPFPSQSLTDAMM